MKTTNKKLEKIVKNFTGKRVLIIGDVMLDEYVFGKTTRLSPEAPVPIVEVEKTIYVPGGAANAVNNARSLGDETILVGVVGNDEKGKRLIELLKGMGIRTDGLLKDPDRHTTLKSRIVCQGQHVVRIDREHQHPISKRLEKSFLDFIKKTIKLIDIVLISDYAKGVVTSLFCQEIIRLGKDASKRVVIDPKGDDFSKYRGCFMITPNLKELEVALKIQQKDLKSLPQLANMLLVHVDSEAVLVTLGEHGMASLDKEKNYLHLPSADVKVVDISGAGDTAIAALSLALASNASLHEAMLISTYACSVVIGKIGTAVVSRNELINALRTVRLKDHE